jgi:hypothetical protein
MRTGKRGRALSSDPDDGTWVKLLRRAREDAAKALESLVRRGCDRPYMIECMRVISLAQATRMSRKKVLKAVKALRAARDCVKRIEGSDVRSVIARHPEVGELEWELEEYADSVEAVAHLSDGRRALEYDDCLAAMVRHVESATGRPDDASVSLLVEASPDVRLAADEAAARLLTPEQRSSLPEDPQPSKVRTREDYSADAQLHWRGRHHSLLARETRFERAWRAKQERAASGWTKLRAHLDATASVKRPATAVQLFLKKT